MQQEQARPQPLSKILDVVLPDKVGVVLHGTRSERYWALREVTRKDRSMLAWIEEILMVSRLKVPDPIRVRWVKGTEEIAARVTEVVREALVEA